MGLSNAPKVTWSASGSVGFEPSFLRPRTCGVLGAHPASASPCQPEQFCGQLQEKRGSETRLLEGGHWMSQAGVRALFGLCGETKAEAQK